MNIFVLIFLILLRIRSTGRYESNVGDRSSAMAAKFSRIGNLLIAVGTFHDAALSGWMLRRY